MQHNWLSYVAWYCGTIFVYGLAAAVVATSAERGRPVDLAAFARRMQPVGAVALGSVVIAFVSYAMLSAPIMIQLALWPVDTAIWTWLILSGSVAGVTAGSPWLAVRDVLRLLRTRNGQIAVAAILVPPVILGGAAGLFVGVTGLPYRGAAVVVSITYVMSAIVAVLNGVLTWRELGNPSRIAQSR